MPLPTFLIIGSARSGTTSLHYYLSQHPQISMSRPKEVNFFSHDDLFARGPEWYAGHFPGVGPHFGESSPKYTVYPHIGGVPRRIAGLLPEVKLIYLLRDPVERVVSRYLHDWSLGLQSQSLSRCLYDLEGCSYVSGGRYAMQLEQYLEHFPAEQILILNHRHLLEQRQHTLEQVYRFLGCAEIEAGAWQQRHLNPTSIKRRLNPVGKWIQRWLQRLPLGDTASHRLERLLTFPFSSPLPRNPLIPQDRQRLEAFFRPDVDRLRQLTGLDFADWGWAPCG